MNDWITQDIIDSEQRRRQALRNEARELRETQVEQRAVTMFRKHYRYLRDKGPDAFEFAPDIVAYTATCTACLEVLGLEDESEFFEKYGD